MSVTTRLSASASRTDAISASRPTSGVTEPGRLEGGSIVRSGRASSAAPITSRRWSCAGSSKSLTALSPSSTSRTPSSVHPASAWATTADSDDLAAVAGGGDARGVVHVDADIVLGVSRSAAIPKPALALVEAHPDTQRRLCRPGLGGERALGGDDSVRGIVRPLERREEGVTLGLDDDAPSRLDRLPQQSVVARDDGGPGSRSHRPLEPCRALDVGEQERDGRTCRESHQRRPSSQACVHAREGEGSGGRYWVRTSDLTDVNRAL